MATEAQAQKVDVNVRPLYDRVVVRRMEPEEEVRGGIIIPDTAKEKPLEGIVVAVGEGKRLEDGSRAPMEVEEGDRILLQKYGGTEIQMQGEDFVIVKEEDILGVVEG